MKRKCKDVDLRDYKNHIPAIKDVVSRHYKRYDFRGLLLKFGLSIEDYELYKLTTDDNLLKDVYNNIAKECVDRITNRDLKLPKVQIGPRIDKSSGKVRLIGKESAMQQIFDYIAYYGAKEIFDKRIVSEQASSIEGRGQLYGTRIIKRWIDQDNDAMRYAKRHNTRYRKKCVCWAKTDIKQCYPNADLDKFMVYFSKECGNKDLLWLWYTLLKSHQVNGYTGFMIGSLVSQWAVQYMLSIAYRFVKNLHYERRGKSYKCIEHNLIFMDDNLMIGSNRKQMLFTIRQYVTFMKEEFGFDIKVNWQIHYLAKDPIDMMGFVVYADGHIEIRNRDFVKARRMVKRYYFQDDFLTYKQCKRISSYKGYFKYSDSKNVSRKYNLKKVFKYVSKKISFEEKKKNGQ